MPGTRNGHRPRCSATLRDGVTQCSSFAEPGGLCRRHAAELEAAAAPVEEQADAAVHLSDDAEAEMPEAEQRLRGPLSAGEFRGAVAEDLASRYEDVVTTMFQAAGATKLVYGSCPACKVRVQLPAPDWQARVAAVRYLTEVGIGKPAAPADEPDLETACAVVRDSVGVRPIGELTQAELEVAWLGALLDHPDGVDSLVARVRESEAIAASLDRRDLAQRDDVWRKVLRGKADRAVLERLARLADELLREADVTA